MTEERNGNGRGASIPRGYQQEDTEARRSWLKEHAGVELDDTLEDKAEDLQGIIENHVGFMKVPMALVGPMILLRQEVLPTQRPTRSMTITIVRL